MGKLPHSLKRPAVVIAVAALSYLLLLQLKLPRDMGKRAELLGGVGTKGAGAENILHPVLVGDDRFYFAGTDGRVREFEAKTGQPVWETPLAVTENGQPISLEGRGVLGNGVLFETAPGGSIVAIDVRSGEVRWKQTIDANGFIGSLAYLNGYVYVPVMGKGRGKIVAVNAQDKTVAWEFPLAQGMTILNRLTVDQGNTTLLFASGDVSLPAYAAITGLDARTGRLKWTWRPGQS